MADYVRVRDPQTGYHVTVTRERAEQFNLTPLKEEAVNANGFPLPPKYKTTVDDEAAKKETKR